MDLKRMLSDKKFYLAVLLAFVGLLIGTPWPEFKVKSQTFSPFSSGTFLSTLEKALKSRTVCFLIPVAAVLPCGDTYLRERQRQFLRFLILRRGKKDYCRDKVLTTALSGALVWVTAALLGLLFFFVLLYGREEIGRFPENAVAELLCTVGRICLISSLLASFGTLCGTLSGSVYLALGFPFILYSFGIIIRERYLESFYVIDPSEWILAKNDWGNNQYALWLFLLLFTIGMALLHLAVLEWKVETPS